MLIKIALYKTFPQKSLEKSFEKYQKNHEKTVSVSSVISFPLYNKMTLTLKSTQKNVF